MLGSPSPPASRSSCFRLLENMRINHFASCLLILLNFLTDIEWTQSYYSYFIILIFYVLVATNSMKVKVLLSLNTQCSRHLKHPGPLILHDLHEVIHDNLYCEYIMFPPPQASRPSHALTSSHCCSVKPGFRF